MIDMIDKMGRPSLMRQAKDDARPKILLSTSRDCPPVAMRFLVFITRLIASYDAIIYINAPVNPARFRIEPEKIGHILRC
jgi:hypothetical protein